MDIDSLLSRIKLKGRPVTRTRLLWWLVTGLNKLFGRAVKIENTDGETIRIFPIVWNGKIHLLGTERDFFQLDFTSQYTVRVRRAPDVRVSPGRPAPEPDKEGRIIHIILGHVAPRSIERILQHAQNLAPDYVIVLAYGGTRENFDHVAWQHKVFVDDENLHGYTFNIAYGRLTALVKNHLELHGIKPQWVLISDYDFLPLKRQYLDEAIRTMTAHGAGAGGKLIREVSLSNNLFLTHSLLRGRIDDSLNGPGRQPIYHALGCGFVLHGECFNHLFDDEPNLGTIFFELGVFTAANRKGYRLISFDLLSDEFKEVRYRPVYTPAEALKLAAAGATFVHPVKQTDPFFAEWKAPALPAAVTATAT